MPLGWVAAAGAVSGIAGAVASSNAASDQADASRNAQNISQQQYTDTVNRNAPFTQAGYGALSNLDYLLGIGPQDQNGNPVSQGGASRPNGVDPSSGYRIGAGGGISQGIPSPTAAGSRYGSIGQNGYSLGQTVLGNATSNAAGGLGGSGAPIAGGSATPAPGQTSVAGGSYGSLLKNFDTSDWQALSPAYNFQKQQGMQGVLNGATAGQGALSGAAYKDLIDYNQNEANTSFNNAFNQYQTQQGNIYSRLAGIAQIGQASANNTGQQGTALAGQAAQSATNIGAAQAAGSVGIGNAISGAASSAAPWLAYGAGGGGVPDLVAGGDNAGVEASGGQLWSDRRLKQNIERIGQLDSGIPIYRFRYIADPTQLHVGVMADEVMPLVPEAVIEHESGFFKVDYSMVR